VSTTIEFPIFRSALQGDLLTVILLNPERTWTTRELEERLDATPVAIHRELHRALDAGLVTRRAIGRTFLYSAATDSPLYEPLRMLVERTHGVEVELERELRNLPGVEGAFIHGSFARGSRIKPTSDIDLLVLGDVDHNLTRKRVRSLENRTGREIDLKIYKPEEFAALIRKRNSFARSVLRGPVRALIGSLDELVEAS
jgi:predicted nucleotidyltransferase